MADKYLYNNAGVLTEKEASASSAGVTDAGKVVALNAEGDIDASMLPPGIAPDISVITASEGLSSGDFVNIWNDAGTPKARKADGSTSGKHAHGFVLEAVSQGNPADVYFDTDNNQVTGATAGDVFLSATTPGGFQASAPSGTGQVVQRLGVATAATNIKVEIQQPLVLA